ncbi:MAG TPA: VCBS repeat-containing protein [Vicinamibacteria bacterium]|nr:VCBS repeat-containing protein [Vicinamibacteria bacterium]
MSWSPRDSDTAPGVGSVRLTNGFNSPAGFGMVRALQCIAGGVVPDGPYSATARVLVPPGQPHPVVALVDAFFYEGPNCDGFVVGGQGSGYSYGPAGTGGFWDVLDTDVTEPAAYAAQSVLVGVTLLKEAGQGDSELEAYFDAVTLQGQAGFVKGDMNRDGETDLIVRNQVTGSNQIWYMNNTVRDGTPVTISPAAPSLDWSIAGVDDFNGDKRSDLLMWNQLTGAAQIWLMNDSVRDGDPIALPGALPPPWKPSATADFNHDGQPDIVYRNSATQKIVIWTMNGATPVGQIVPVPDQAVDSNWEIVAALDFNGDANTDFLWYNATSGKIVLWFMDANVVRVSGQFTSPAQAGNNNWKVLAAGDYGIGAGGLWNTRDIVWRNETSGRFVVWHMDRSGVRTSGTFTTPMEPTPDPTLWTIAGPR